MVFSSILITVVLFVTPHVGGNTIADVGCPTGFQRRNNQCFKLMELQATWPEAKLYCQVIGGDLARITSADLQSTIADLVSKSPARNYWIDGSDMLQNREFRWMMNNGKSVKFEYTNWHIGEPSSRNENCVEVRHEWNSMWNDLACIARTSFICQARATYCDEMIFNEEMDC